MYIHPFTVCISRDDDMMSITSMMSVSNLSTIGFLEDEDDEAYYWYDDSIITSQNMSNINFNENYFMKLLPFVHLSAKN